MAFINAEHQACAWYMTMTLARTKFSLAPSVIAHENLQLTISTALCKSNRTGGVETNQVN